MISERAATAAGTLAATMARTLQERRAAGGTILCYHDVFSGSAAAAATPFAVTADQLRGHIETIRRLGCSVTSLQTMVDRLAAGQSVQSMVAVTFDDALEGVGRHAAPVLADAGVTATVFVVTDRPGTRPEWWPEARRTMEEQELAQLHSNGHTLGSHTHTHRSLPAQTDGQISDELNRSRHHLHSLTGISPTLLAYPSGHHDSRIRNAAQQAGFGAACTFLNGTLGGSEDLFMLPRLTMGSHMSNSRLIYHMLRPVHSWPDHQVDVLPGPLSR